MKKFINIFTKKKKELSSKYPDINRLKDQNDMLKASMSSFPSSSNSFNDFFGNKITEDLNYHSVAGHGTEELRNLSRIAMNDTPQAAAALERLSENVINAGMTLDMTPIWDIVSPSKDEIEKKKWTKKVEQYWKLFATSKEVSYDKKKTLQQLQSIFYYNLLRDGEVFIIMRYSSDINKLNPLSLQIIDASHIVDPLDREFYDAAIKKGNTIIDGIEFGKTGEEVAFFVEDTITGKVQRVEKMGKLSKRQFVIHSMLTKYSDQARGVPFLSGVLHEMQKITDYSLLELQAAVINAVIAVWVEPSDQQDSSKPLFGVRAKDPFQISDSESTVEQTPDSARFTKGGLMMQNLKKGEKLASYDTKRPNVNFETFVTAIMKNLSSSLSIPMEVMTMTFGQNYSASRASLLLFWNTVIKHRSNFTTDILDPVFEMWMIGEVEAGRVEASGFNNVLMRRAWLNKRWVGISQPSIDPLKEGKAVSERLAHGLTTHEIESQRNNGTSFDDNIRKLKEENQALSDAQASIPEEETKESDSKKEKDDDGEKK